MNAHFLIAHATHDWPLVKLIKEQWPDATIDCRGVKSLTYRNRIEYAFKLLRYVWLAFSSGFAALARDPAPAVLCAYSDVEVLGFALARFLRRKQAGIILIGFIYTTRKSKLTSLLRMAYFRFVLSRTAGVICHSQLEVKRYTGLFGLGSTRFVNVPYGINLEIPASIVAADLGYILTAGRS